MYNSVTVGYPIIGIHEVNNYAYQTHILQFNILLHFSEKMFEHEAI